MSGADNPAKMADFAASWEIAATVVGWLTEAQGRLLFGEAARLSGNDRIVEIGSHQGRSTCVLAAASGSTAPVVAIDPFIEGRLFGGSGTRQLFEQNIARAGLVDRVRLIADKSTAVRPRWAEPIQLLYIDGKHDYWTVTDDLKWTEHVVAGGTVVIHDSFSSIGVTLALMRHVLLGSELRYAGRTGSLARFVRSRPRGRDRARLVAQLPWFARNVVIKIGLRLARVVGYRGTPDPY